MRVPPFVLLLELEFPMAAYRSLAPLKPRRYVSYIIVEAASKEIFWLDVTRKKFFSATLVNLNCSQSETVRPA